MKSIYKTAGLLLTGRFLFLGVVFVGILCLQCKQNKTILDEEVYTGPSMVLDSVETLMTDSGQLVVILRAPKQLDFENGDREYPLGLYLEYYETDSLPVCTFRANTAHYKKESDIWKGEGDVQVLNLDTKDELKTEELFWDPSKKKFYTNKFVTILSEGELHTGEGLTADQDFNRYQILNPTGTITVEEDNE